MSRGFVGDSWAFLFIIRQVADVTSVWFRNIFSRKVYITFDLFILSIL